MLVKHWASMEDGRESVLCTQISYDGTVLMRFSLRELLPHEFPEHLYNVCSLGNPFVLDEKLLFICVHKVDGLGYLGLPRRYELALVTVGIEKLFQGGKK